ncbi:hypothetical protein HAX54_050220 [Datura stramonium]|uniref:B box-type domain-containing protein n=1 Tax=Datura stramonium TaxID=4076 RepID=A0ABS8SWU3_DATST|nr:hypothetical protein [Datura stramonium]
MSKKNCELCGKKRAKMYCESDQASLCWDCDSEVHSANFLVEKHSRNLLCHSCQKLTPWTASGPQLSPTFSVCSSCLVKPAAAVRLRDPTGDRSTGYGERVEENYQTGTDDEDEDEYGSESETDEYDDDDDGDGEDNGNQVVPLSSSPSSSSFSLPSPGRSVSSSGSYEDLSAAGDGGTTGAVSSSPWKRLRGTDCLHSEDEEDCSSGLNCHSLFEENKGTSSSIGFLRPMKMLRTSV